MKPIAKYYIAVPVFCTIEHASGEQSICYVNHAEEQLLVCVKQNVTTTSGNMFVNNTFSVSAYVIS